MTSPEAAPRTAAQVTEDWLSGALLVAFGSVLIGQYAGKAEWDDRAREVIDWLRENGMVLAIEAEAAAGDAEAVIRFTVHSLRGHHRLLVTPTDEAAAVAAIAAEYARLAGAEKPKL